MINFEEVQKLMKCFPNSFINQIGELIVHRASNTYLVLRNCQTELDIKCKVIEQLSRAAYKTCPYGSDRKNKEFNRFILNGLNKYLDTTFDETDMDVIYTKLGNGVHHGLTVQFITSGFNLEVLYD